MRPIASFGLVVAVSFAAGCSTPEPERRPGPMSEKVIETRSVEPPTGNPNPLASVTEAIATVNPTTHGGKVHGTVRFVQTADGVRVVADIEGLKPNARHGF